MSKISKSLIPTIWPLPGGNSRYLYTLDQIIKWVDGTSEPTKEKFLSWLASQYNAPKSASGYLQLVLRTEALKSSNNGQLSIGDLGHQILQANDEAAKAGIVIRRFMEDYLAFREMLAKVLAFSLNLFRSTAGRLV